MSDCFDVLSMRMCLPRTFNFLSSASVDWPRASSLGSTVLCSRLACFLTMSVNGEESEAD